MRIGGRYADVVARQLAAFEQDNAELVSACDAAERAYDNAERDEAEERYGDFQDLVATGTEALADLRDHFAQALDEDSAAEYERAFNKAVKKRFSRFGVEIDRT